MNNYTYVWVPDDSYEDRRRYVTPVIGWGTPGHINNILSAQGQYETVASGQLTSDFQRSLNAGLDAEAYVKCLRRAFRGVDWCQVTGGLPGMCAHRGQPILVLEGDRETRSVEGRGDESFLPSETFMDCDTKEKDIFSEDHTLSCGLVHS